MAKKCEEKWECYVCGKESFLQLIPGGWLGNYHPLVIHARIQFSLTIHPNFIKL